MSRKEENSGFSCEYCGCQVLPLTNGSFRNHCPSCLCSKHVDDRPGDRQNPCGGRMVPVGVVWKRNKGWQLIQRCLRCGHVGRNKVARDTVQPDNWEAVVSLSGRKPL